MSGYIPGSIQQTIFKTKSSEINSDLDALFKNSAGPVKIPTIIFKESLINHVEHKIKNINAEDNESVLCKKKHNASHKCHFEMNEEILHNKKLESKKSIEEKYEVKAMQKEMKSSYKKKVSSETNEEINLNGEKHLKRKYLAKDLKFQKRTRVTEDITSDKSDFDEEANIQHTETKISTKGLIDLKTMNVDENDRHKNESPSAIKKDDIERLQRTIFVGNLSVSVAQKTNYKKLKTFFSQFGKIESIRFRSIAFSELLPRKLAFITGKFHPERDVLNAYIVYKEQSSVQQAITVNAQVFLGKHLRVDSVSNPQNHDRRRTVFIGSLSFDAQEEELWLHFESCGEIENVRIVRDNKTNIGKGFAYVQFKERASVELALKLNDTKLGTRQIRVTRCAKGNNTSKPSSHKLVKDKQRSGKVKFGKKLSVCKLEKGKPIQKYNKLLKQTFEGTRSTKSKNIIQFKRRKT